MSKTIFALAFVAVASAASALQALTYPFTEDFSLNNAAWLNNANTFVTYNSSGGPDGSGFVSGTFNFQNTTPTSQDPVIFRANLSTPAGPASGGAFFGNWISSEVKEFNAYVRHNAAEPMTFFTRYAVGAFPGIILEQPNIVQPNTWTQIQFSVTPQNPYYFDEGTGYSGIFNNINRVQIGVAIPPSLVGQNQTITFDLDQPTITIPEPSTILISSFAALAIGCVRRRSS